MENAQVEAQVGKPAGISIFYCGIQGFVVIINGGVLHVVPVVKDAQVIVYADMGL